MKVILIIVTSLILSMNSFASHIAAGELYYDYLGNNNYEVHLVLYRDCIGVQYDELLSFTVFDNAYTVVQEVTMALDTSFIEVVDYSTISAPSCLSQSSGVCLEYYKYSETVNLPPINGGYHIVYQRCCVSEQFVNIQSPETLGYTFQSKIPGLETGRYENSSPRFLNSLLFLGCLNQTSTYFHEGVDPDGDSLVYSSFIPTGIDLSFAVDPSPEYPGPYQNITYDVGFSEQDQLGVGGILVVNPVTAEVVMKPIYVGMFAFGIQIEEYHSDTLLNTTYGFSNLQVSLSDLGVSDQLLAESLLLLPNPVSDVIEINLPYSHVLTVFSADGRIVSPPLKINQFRYILDLSSYKSGLYYFRFDTKEGSTQVKVVKV